MYAPSQSSGSPMLPPLSDTAALGRAGSPSPPFADRHTNLLYVSKLSLFNGGLGEPRPTSCLAPGLDPSGPRVLAHAFLANMSTCQPAS